jgi:hypothetical protein
MRGVKYNMTFKIGKDHYENHNNMTMKELCEKVKLLIKENYMVDMKITNQKLYNVMNRPHMAHKLLNAIVTVEKNTV